MSQVTISSCTPENALQYLQQLIGQACTKENLQKLSGPTAFTVQSMNDSTVAVAYLEAAAKHLPSSRVATTTAAPVAAVADRSNLSVEIRQTEIVNEVLQTVGDCVTKISPRSRISESGILTVLCKLQQNEEFLCPAHIEFLQSCIYAEQYASAERQISNTWPRPNKKFLQSVSKVEQVLRYYYLRGVIHMGCQNWLMAVRSFWTCLSIPGSDQNVISAIAIAAWKKLILVQCCQADCLEPNRKMKGSTTKFSSSSSSSAGASAMEDISMSKQGLDFSPQQLQQSWAGPLSVPKEMPAAISRFISAANPPSNSQSMGTSEPGGKNSGLDNTDPVMSPGRLAAAPEEHPDAMHMVEMDSGDVMNQSIEEGVDSDTVQYPSLGVRVYSELVKAFLDVDREKFDAIANEHSPLFLDDGNVGMVERASTVLLRRQLYEISSMFSAIPQDQLAAELGLSIPETLELLSQISNEIRWPVIRQESDGIIHFPSLPPTTALVTEENIHNTHIEMTQLRMNVVKMDLAIANSNKYAKARRQTDAAMKIDNSGPRGVEDF